MGGNIQVGVTLHLSQQERLSRLGGIQNAMLRKSVWLLAATLLVIQGLGSASTKGFRVSYIKEASIEDIHGAMKKKELTARELVQMYLDRIEAYDKKGPFLNSIITINPKAAEIAEGLDRKLAESGLVGPLHGIPIIVKDNLDTHDMPTTNGVLALKDSIPPDDANVILKLKEAGAIILAKANMAEFAFAGADTVSSVLPGYTRNPYDTRYVSAGSSGGTAAAIAANFATVGIGTDTGASVRGPSSHQSLVGIRATMGLISRDGICPLSSARDMAGPMTRTVADAVRVLEVIAGYDPDDPVTAACQDRIPDSYSQSMDRGGLKGARLGVARQMFDPEDADPEVIRVMESALAELKSLGAVLIDPVQIEGLKEIRDSFQRTSRMKYDFDRYLASLGPNAPYKTLEAIVESEKFHPNNERRLRRALEVEEIPDENPKYQHNLEVADRLREAVVQVFDDHQLDAIIYPTFKYAPRLIGDLNTPYGSNSSVLAPPIGFPAITVPMGYTYGRLPAGIQFLGRPFSEPTLIKLGYSYEQATLHRRPPSTTPPLN
jgi:Asp-tRNA(Asn)/Glu-tRNA(Gln) amidotransferase A subunit family amidase